MINANNTIIGGHQRINILKAKYGANGMEVDVRVPSRELTKQEEQELNIRLNKNLGEWDFDALANFDEELLKDIGFESQELDKIFQIDTTPEDDDVPEQRQSDIKAGDMFQLGEHRLLCGDATQKADVERLMAGEKADMVFTDPPYNIGYDYWDYLDSIETSDYKKWCEDWFEIACSYSPIVLLTIGQWNMKMWFDIAKPLGIVNWIARNKTSGSKIALFSIWEPILVYAKKIIKKKENKADVIDGEIVINDIIFLDEVAEAKRFIENNSDIIEFNNRVQKNVGIHKCPKQVGMLFELFKRYSERDSRILDFFGGSGSTLIACEKLNRKCRMMEIDPIYCQVIIDRWEKYTSKKAEKLNGKNR